MSSTHKSKSVLCIPELSLGEITLPDCAELCRRLSRLRLRQPPAEPGGQPIRIGIEDPYGDLAHVVETTRLTEAVNHFWSGLVWSGLVWSGLVWLADSMQVLSIGFTAPSIAASFRIPLLSRQ